ncbi:VWA domain-containing protein [Scytonema sp. UIC 10036]|uniref:vWA domain-containing protein n=1 Tax=Scytonema sp. UIC 10036 TaxID=2304196 RepID=UPI0012DAD0AF|nr:VWA domain-containing protein [Scytonema sp. UIC 10036]MUG98482.1 VWA domain-containing protein [Scytonema sp. UIC 10036]
MKICTHCGASNLDANKFCTECGTALEPLSTPKGGTAAPSAPFVPITKPLSESERIAYGLSNSLKSRLQQFQGKRSADIMFVLDCTGSMGGEIEAIKDAIMDFADTIESDGVRVRVGLVEFRDRLIQEEHRVLTFNGEPFTSDPVAFRNEVAKLRAGGGGDEPESSLDAILLALRQPFTQQGSKVIVLVTDAPPHIPDLETKSINSVVQAIRDVGVQQLYLVIRTQDPNSQVYLKLLEGARGMAFELGKGDDFRQRAEDFKRTLMALGKTISQATR